jgi:hypothetical protein
MATTTQQQNRHKNTLFYIIELLYMIFCFTAYTAKSMHDFWTLGGRLAPLIRTTLPGSRSC